MAKFSASSVTAFLFLLVSGYQLGPEIWTWSKATWTLTSCKLNPPEGHLEPFGAQRPPMEPVEELYHWPDSQIFYRDYVLANKPVLLKGLAKIQPAFHKWTDQYLLKTFGHEEVAVENGRKQKDYRENLYLTVLSEFIKGYKEKDIYLVDTVSPARFKDVVVPPPLRCGNFARAISDVIMWLSSGGTKSIIHADYVDNINCIFEGKKVVNLLQKSYTDAHGEFRRSDEVDVDKVDLCEFPAYAQLPRHEVTVEAGDCLFLPFMWYHQVNANNARNLGINFWFQHLKWFNESDCLGKDNNAEFPFGSDDMPSAEQLKKFELITYAGKQKSFDLTKFIETYLFNGSTDKKRLTEMFNEMDTDEDGVLTLPEMYAMNHTRFVSFFDNLSGLRFLDYNRERGNLDNTTEHQEL